MKSHKILVLSTYPIKNPKHGGQKRTQAIYHAYKQSFDTKHSAVFFRGFYADYDSDDIPLGSSSEVLVMQSPLTGDVIAGEAIYHDPSVKKRMTKLLSEFSPSVIHIEQPFPYLGLKPLLNELKLTPKIVFGSQNIEAPMKREILKGANVPEVTIVKVEQLIANLEQSLTRESDLVVACTNEDLEVHAKLGGHQLVLAPNGIAPSRTDQRSLTYWQAKFKKQGVNHTVLFVGSAHPPNWTGFLDTIGKGLGFLPYDTRLIIAGSICDYFNREIVPDNLSIEDVTFWLRAISAGRISEKSLGALIQLADIIILPITEGGGSNLKTAEAILADKKVVATSHGLRSFEWFEKFPNVWVADTPAMFRKSIGRALNTPYQPRNVEQQALAKKVEWHNCLNDMVQAVGQL